VLSTRVDSSTKEEASFGSRGSASFGSRGSGLIWIQRFRPSLDSEEGASFSEQIAEVWDNNCTVYVCIVSCKFRMPSLSSTSVVLTHVYSKIDGPGKLG
jgi:hypothetical protein